MGFELLVNELDELFAEKHWYEQEEDEAYKHPDMVVCMRWHEQTKFVLALGRLLNVPKTRRDLHLQDLLGSMGLHILRESQAQLHKKRFFKRERKARPIRKQLRERTNHLFAQFGVYTDPKVSPKNDRYYEAARRLEDREFDKQDPDPVLESAEWLHSVLNGLMGEVPRNLRMESETGIKHAVCKVLMVLFEMIHQCYSVSLVYSHKIAGWEECCLKTYNFTRHWQDQFVKLAQTGHCLDLLGVSDFPVPPL